jgi:hypothetical protein
VPAPPYSEDELHAAIEALTDAERFRAAERVVAAAAPDLQRVLAAALASGGWFDDSHQSAVRKAVEEPDPELRLTAARTLLAEESRITMMIGVAVGWALAEELGAANEPKER